MSIEELVKLIPPPVDRPPIENFDELWDDAEAWVGLRSSVRLSRSLKNIRFWRLLFWSPSNGMSDSTKGVLGDIRGPASSYS